MLWICECVLVGVVWDMDGVIGIIEFEFFVDSVICYVDCGILFRVFFFDVVVLFC